MDSTVLDVGVQLRTAKPQNVSRLSENERRESMVDSRSRNS